MTFLEPELQTDEELKNMAEALGLDDDFFIDDEAEAAGAG